MEEIKKEIGEHYNRTQIFYNLFWLNKENLGMHYGFWEKETKSLDETIINENRAIADILEVEKSDIILDAGCGVGGTTLWLAENYGAKITGITLSAKQAEMAKDYVQKRKVDHLTAFYVKDYCNTDFPNGSFTKIFGIESICYAPNKEAFLRKAYGLLKPGGRLAVTDFYVNKPLNEREEQLVADFCRGWEIPNLPTLERMFVVMGIFVWVILKFLGFLKLRASCGGTKTTISQYYMFKENAATYNIFFAQKL